MEQQPTPLTLDELDQLWNECESRTRPAWEKAFNAKDEEGERQAHLNHQNLLQKILDNANRWRSSTGDSPVLHLPREQRSEARAKVQEFIRLVLAERRRILKLKGEIP